MTARTVQGRHVLAALVAFFGVMMLVNAIFVYFAVATFSGGDTSKPYQKGLDYNQTIYADAAQTEHGWKAELDYRADTLTIRFVDRTGAPVTSLDVAVELTRPTTDKDDRRLILKEVSEGRYSAAIALPEGLWVVSATSGPKDEGGGAYRLKRRLYVAGTP
jgi:nitrogen fixation protein FixH